jgi:hypothetical protein
VICASPEPDSQIPTPHRIGEPMSVHALNPWTELVKLHPDVESGSLAEAVFAIDLGAVATGGRRGHQILTDCGWGQKSIRRCVGRGQIFYRSEAGGLRPEGEGVQSGKFRANLRPAQGVVTKRLLPPTRNSVLRYAGGGFDGRRVFHFGGCAGNRRSNSA